MPDLSRYMIKASLLYLVAALLAGVAMAEPVLSRLPRMAAVYPAYIHLFVFGWLTQLIFGVAYWLFPRASRERPYGRTGLAYAGFILLNVGLLLRVGSEPVLAWENSQIWRFLLAVSAVVQWLAGALFVAYFWARVKRK